MTTQSIIESGMTFRPYPEGHGFHIEKSQTYQDIQEGVKIAELLLLHPPNSPKVWIIEAKSIGADVILLIAACLTPNEVTSLSACARNLGMEVLLEIHSEEELDRVGDDVTVVGINNRDLKTFKVSVETSKKLLPKIPSDKLKISESGIDSADTIRELLACGFDGFLIGEAFMRHANPAEACRSLIRQVQEG